MARKRSPKKLADIVNLYVKKKGYEKRLKEEKILTTWSEVTGATISANTQAVRFHDGTLFVSTKTPSWSHELTLIERDLVSKINKALGQKVVAQCRFSVGTLKKKNVIIHEEEKIEIVPVKIEMSDLQLIQDKDLREHFLIFIQNQKGLTLGKKKAGWVECPLCGNPFKPRENREFCSVCIQDSQYDLVVKVKELLSSYPWLNYTQVYAGVLGVSENSYWQARKELLYIWHKEINELTKQYLDNPVDFDVNYFFGLIDKYVMLNRQLTPDQLSLEVIQKNLSESTKGLYTLLSLSGE